MKVLGLVLIFANLWIEIRTESEPYKYDARRNSYKKNQASPGIYFDPDSGNFKRGNPPLHLLEETKKLREEVKQSTLLHSSSGLRSELPFAKFSQKDHQESSNHR